jgi:hypothetical protein
LVVVADVVVVLLKQIYTHTHETVCSAPRVSTLLSESLINSRAAIRRTKASVGVAQKTAAAAAAAAVKPLFIVRPLFSSLPEDTRDQSPTDMR